MFVLRGGLFVLPMLSSEFSHALSSIVDPSKHLIDMITPPIANINIDVFSPPVEQGTVAVPPGPGAALSNLCRSAGGSDATGTNGILGGRFSGPAGFVD